MAKLRQSPSKFLFRSDKIKQRLNQDPNMSEEKIKDQIETYEKVYNRYEQNKMTEEKSDNFKNNNLEYDLRTTDWIVEKAKAKESYAQNIYAALCNNSFQKQELWPILKTETWSCSWRYAGGIVADMLEDGDYLDWYCTGIREVYQDPEDTNEKQPPIHRGYVSEGIITEEIREDFLKIGWQVFDKEDEE
jgi:hypothetical protein